MSPNCTRSAGCTWSRVCRGCAPFWSPPWPRKPMLPPRIRCLMMLCPGRSNAPPHDEQDAARCPTLDAWPCCGMLAAASGRACLATVPSTMFLSSACCTPSPDTSRVIDSVLALAGDLVDFVDVDDPSLGALRCRSRRPEASWTQDVFHVLAHIPRLGERGRVGDGERHVEGAGQRLGEQRLARARRTEQQNVRSSRAPTSSPCGRPA